MHCVNCKVSAHSSTKAVTLVNCGANGGMTGSDGKLCLSVVLMIISSATCLFALWLVFLQTQHGPVVAIIYQEAYHGNVSTILSMDKWKHTRSRWWQIYSYWREAELRLWKGISSLYNAEVGCLTLRCNHPLTKNWVNFHMLSLLLNPTTHGHNYPTTWPEYIPPRLSDAYIDKTFDTLGNYLHWDVSQAISSLASSDGPPLSLGDAIDSLNVQLSAHGHVTQVKAQLWGP